jgi:hypothetical protein
VIPLGLRLAVRGGRETATRLVLLVIAVGLGAGLLLAALAGINAVNAQNKVGEPSWMQGSSFRSIDGTATVEGSASSRDHGTTTLEWLQSHDVFQGQSIDRFDVAVTSAPAPVLPGIPRDPAPGQYYASPALVALLRGNPASELADRYPGHLVGTIANSALGSPNELDIIIGRAPAQLANNPDVGRLTGSHTSGGLLVNSPLVGQGFPPIAIDFVMSVVALALLTPVLIFIATATRLAAARREQRLAAMRLVGATRRQISLIAAVESTVAALGGVAIGFGVFFLFRDPLASIPFTGVPFFPSQLSLSILDIVAVVVGVPVGAAIVARFSLRRVHISPLGVTRRVTPKPPSAWRLILLLAGVVELGFFVIRGHPVSVSGQVQAFFTGFLLIIIGLIIAGPWLTMVAAQFMARRARRPGPLIAARRLADDPRASFRAVSGLVLALFVTTVAVATLTTENDKQASPQLVSVASGVLIDQVSGIGMYGGGGGPAPVLPTSLTTSLRAITGVTGVVDVHAVANLNVSESGTTGQAGLVSCAQLATVPALGRCPSGAQVVEFPLDPTFTQKSVASITWPASSVTPQRLTTIGLDSVNVATNGSASAVERARTVLENAYPVSQAPETIGEFENGANSVGDAFQQLADVVIVASLAIAGCTLAASIAGGLADRKRPFSMLRLTGARLATLRRVVLLESAVPLLAVAVIAIAAGFGASALYSSAEMERSLAAPGPEYYLITAAGILASLVVIAATFPLLRRITGPEVARNE